MRIELSRQALLSELREQVKDLSEQNLLACYQCGKCSAGCPIAEEMDLLPNQVIRLAMIGARDLVLRSRTPWLCAQCETCTTRCPEEIDIAGVMDKLRKIALDEGIKPPESGIYRFNRIFVDSIRKRGRVYELGMVMRYNMLSGQPMKDADMGPAMFLKQKIAPLPHGVKDKGRIRRIFERSRRFMAGGEAK